MRPNRSRLAAALGAVALAATPAAAVRLDLEAAVERALARNPALAAVEELRSQVAGGIREARGDAFPEVAAVSSWGQSRSPSFLNSPDFEEILEQFPGSAFEPSVQELTTARIEVSQPIWTFGKVRAAIDLAEIVGEAAEAQIATARLDTARAAAEAYYDVLAAREGLATIEAERDYRRNDLERVESLLEIGEATELERLRARTALVEIEPLVARRRGQIEVSQARLRQVLALPPDEPLELEPAARELPEPPPIESLLEVAASARPELVDLERQEQAYGKQKQIERADGLPQIDLDGFWGREVRETSNLTDPLYDSWAVAVGLRWEFFDGGRRRGRIEQIESQRLQVALRRADLESQVGLDNRQALAAYDAARARARAADVAALTAREAARVARESYEQGIATQTDLLDAQSRATAAEVVAVEAFYDALDAAAGMARAAGRLPTLDWNTFPEERPE